MGLRVRNDLLTKPPPYFNKSEKKKKKKYEKPRQFCLSFWMSSMEQPLNPNHNEDVL